MKKFKKYIYIIPVLATFTLPLVSFAQTPTVPGCPFPASPTFGSLMDFFTCNISRSVIPLIFVLALVAFVWGVVQYVILGAEEEAKRAKGKQFMLWGIIALTVMVSVWGLVNILTTTFGINNGHNFIPQLQTH